MCGIAGVYDRDGRADLGRLHQMSRLELAFQFGRDVVIEGRIDRGIDGNFSVFHVSILAHMYGEKSAEC